MGAAVNHKKDLKDYTDDGLVQSGTLSSTDVDKAVFRSALRKLDLFLLPAVTFIYFLNFLDR